MNKFLRNLSTINLINKKLDLVFTAIILSVGILGLYLAINLKWKYLTVGLPFTMSAVLYCLYKCSKNSNGNSTSLDIFNITYTQKRRLLKVVNIFLLIVFCVGLINNYSTEYNISTIYILSVLFLVFFVLLSVILQEPVCFSLIKIILLSYYIQMTTLFEFPSFIGIDPLFHAELISRIIKTAHFVPYNQYFFYPIMHVYVVVTSLVSNINIKDAMAICISLPYTVIEICLIYLIGVLLYDRKAALIGGLIFGVSNLTFRYGSYVISPTTLGVIFFSLLVYFIFKSFICGNCIRNKILMLSIFFIEILTHTISTFITVTVQLILILSEKVHNKLFVPKTSKIMSTNYFLFVSISTVAYWVYASGFYYYILKAITLNLSMDNLSGAYIIRDNPFSVRYLADYMDQILLYMFVIIGSLKVLDRRMVNKERFLHMSIGMLLLFIATLGIAASLNAIIPDRWYVYALFILSVNMALGVIYIAKISTNKVLNSFLLIIILLSITFFNIIDTETSVVGHTDVNPLAVRKGFYESELIAANTIITKFDNNPLTDAYYLLYITNNLNSTTKDSINQEDTLKLPTITSYLLNGLNSTDKKLLIRNGIFNTYFYDFKGIAMIPYDLDKALEKENRSLIYNSKTVCLYT